MSLYHYIVVTHVVATIIFDLIDFLIGLFSVNTYIYKLSPRSLRIVFVKFCVALSTSHSRRFLILNHWLKRDRYVSTFVILFRSRWMVLGERIQMNVIEQRELIYNSVNWKTLLTLPERTPTVLSSRAWGC